MVGLQDRLIPDSVMHLLADHEQLALEGINVAAVFATGDEHLADDRLNRLDAVAQNRVVGRHVAPAENALSFRRNELVERGDGLRPALLVARQKDEADRIGAGFGQIEPQRRRFLTNEPVRHLDQDAGAVAGEHVRSGRSAVAQIRQDLKALLDDLVTLAVLYIGHEADAAGVVLVARIVETLFDRQGTCAHLAHPSD